MNYLKAFTLNHNCAMALVYAPNGEYDTYQGGIENAHIEATLAHVKRVMADAASPTAAA